MSLNEDLILTIELDNQDEIEKVIKDLEKSLKLNVKSESVLPTKPPKFKKPPEPIDIINYDKAEKFINSVQRTFIKIGDEADLNPFEILPQKKLDRFIGAFKEIGVSVDAETTIGDLVPVYNKMFSEVLTGHKKETIERTPDDLQKKVSKTKSKDSSNTQNKALAKTVTLNKETIERTPDDLQKKVSKSSPSEVSAEVKTAKAVEKTVSAKEEALRITKDISNFNNKELRDVNESMKQKKLESKILNDHMKIVGDTGKVWKVSLNEQTGMYERLLEDKKDVNTESDKEGRKLDTLIRKYRWFQSFLLVTQNFIGMMGKSVKAFGSAMKLLTAPFVLFLNLLLIPILPLLADLSKWLMDIVQGYKDWSEENETLAGIIGGVAFTSILGFMGLALAAWVWGVIKKVGTLITKIPLIGPLFTKMGIKGKAAIKGLIAKLKGTGGLTGALESVKTKLKGTGGLTGALGGVKTKMTGLTTAGLPLLGAALVGLGIGVLVVNLIKAAGGFDKLSDATQGWRTSLMETEDTARSLWTDDSFLTNAFQATGDFVNAITGDMVLTRSLANKNLAKTMKGEAGYGEGLDELMTGLYGPNVLRSAEGVGGYTNVRTGQQISKIDESSYNIYIQNKDKSWYEIQSEIKSQKAIEGGVYS